MKNDINIIKNSIIEELNEKEKKRQKQKQADNLKELKDLCKYLINTTIQKTLKTGVLLNEIYFNRDIIINEILEDIKNQYIEINDNDSWNLDAKKQVRLYPYPDYKILDILKTTFYSEYIKIKKELNEERLLLKKKLEKKLYNYFIATFEEGKRQNCILYYILINLRDNHYKQLSINDLASNKQEVEILNSIYYQTLNEVKKGYDTIKPKTINAKNKKLSLPWRIIAYKTALKKIWKS